MQYFIGIDGGGSRSRLVAIDKDKAIIARLEGSSTNITAETYEGVFNNIQNLLREFCVAAGVSLEGCQSLCIGSAGASTGDNEKLLEKIFRDIGIKGKIKVINDAELVLMAATGEEPGIIIIAGTGSVGYAIDKDGATYRAGGWGHLIDDGGSGYRIGIDAIKAALMDLDGRGQKTVLTSAVAEFFGQTDPVQILGYIYSNSFHKSKIAKIAKLVEEAAKQGDNVANTIEITAAKDLTALAYALIHKAQLFAHKIVLNGGIILHNQNIRTMFESSICEAFPNMQIVPMSESAELGAAYIAFKNML